MKKLNIVIPAAGLGTRFKNAGYDKPKCMIDVLGEPMISKVIKNLQIPNRKLKFYFIILKEHCEEYQIENIIKKLSEYLNFDYHIEIIEKLTEGSPCSVLKVRRYINNEDNLLIANVDQYLNWSSDNFINLIDETENNGALITSFSNNPKWSYIRINDEGYVTEVKEKEVISNIANTGIFYFNKGSDFVEATDDMILRNIRINNEFYTAPAINYLINTKGQKFINYPLSNQAFWGLGIPSDLEKFIEHYKNKKL